MKIDLNTVLIGGAVLVGGILVYTHVIQPMMRKSSEDSSSSNTSQHELIEKAIAKKDPSLNKETIKKRAKDVVDRLNSTIDSVNDSSQADKKLPANSTAFTGLSIY